MFFCTIPYLSNSMKNLLFIFIFFIGCMRNASAQQSDFCSAVSVILKDAVDHFRNVRHPDPENIASGTTYKCTIPVPGVSVARFIAATNLFYEGALKQAKTADELKPEFDKYKEWLNACLSSKGYIMREVPNRNPGLEKYKKVMFMADFSQNGPPAIGHVTLDIDYNKISGLYTILLYIYEK